MSSLVSGISKLNPFSGSSKVDDEDKGDAIDANTVAGGGHASRESHITKDRLRVSKALREILYKENVLSKGEAGIDNEEPTTALRELLDKSHIRVPAEVLDRNHPLPEYFISSSHNTYLMAHQLFGSSDASAYEIALHTGSRCVEIDAWVRDIVIVEVDRAHPGRTMTTIQTNQRSLTDIHWCPTSHSARSARLSVTWLTEKSPTRKMLRPS